MSTYERDKLNVNGDTVNLRDAGAVRFDRAQSLTAAQQAQARDNIGAGTGTGGVTGVKGSAESSYRTGNVNLTPANIGLGNVDNTSDADKPVSTAQQAALNGKVDKVTGKGLSTNDYTDADKAALAGKLDASQKGAAGGVAELDSGGKVPSAQLPSYVDDVVEYAGASAFPATGETGKIYVDTTANKTYRWSGSGYVEISPSLALGETSSTAYRGDRGKAAYDHAAAKGSEFASGLYKITTNAEGHVTAATEAAKSDITALGIPGQDTTYQDATTSASGLMSAADKTKLDGIAAGAQVNSVTGVKGSAENNYRTGQVNLTPANIGALSTQGGTLSGNFSVNKQNGTTFIAIKLAEYGGVEAGIMIGNNGHHGVYSNGYWDGTKFVSDWKWILYRANNAELRSALSPATQWAAGVMSAADKTKLDGIKEIKHIDVGVKDNIPSSFIPISEMSEGVVDIDNFISCFLIEANVPQYVGDDCAVITYNYRNSIGAMIININNMQAATPALYTVRVRYWG